MMMLWSTCSLWISRVHVITWDRLETPWHESHQRNQSHPLLLIHWMVEVIHQPDICNMESKRAPQITRLPPTDPTPRHYRTKRLDNHSQLLLRALFQRLLTINQHAPPLAAACAISKSSNRCSRELPLSIRQLIRAKTPRLQPHSLDTCISRLFQNLLCNLRRRNHAQTGLARLLQL
jgi:hypothetical protein